MECGGLVLLRLCRQLAGRGEVSLGVTLPEVCMQLKEEEMFLLSAIATGKLPMLLEITCTHNMRNCVKDLKGRNIRKVGNNWY